VRVALLAAVVLLAGCGGGEKHTAATAPRPPLGLAKRCGAVVEVPSRTLWFTASDGVRLAGAELGRGPRGVILLHESPADLCGWVPYGETLAQRGFHVLLVDLRGYGDSARGLHGGARGAIADASGAVDRLNRLGAKHVVLVGASYGGVNALVAAPALGSRISAVASLSGELNLGGGLDALDAVKHLHVPLLVLGSRDDPYLRQADARRLVRAASSADKRLVEFDGGVHGWDLLADRIDRKRADDVLTTFLREHTQ
jgi:pimeloyl-ACP methyl ester carboxylesterase